MKIRDRVLGLALLLSPSILAGQALATTFTPGAPFELLHGVVVDPARGVVFLAAPQGGIEAVDIGNGRSLWTSDQAALPLALINGLLVAQGEGPSRGSHLPIVVLDAGGGRKVLDAAIPLPEGVKARVGDHVGRSFRARAQVTEGGIQISWSYSEPDMSGAASERDKAQATRSLEGAALVEFGSGRVTTLSGAPGALRPAGPPLTTWRVGSVIATTEGGQGTPLVLKRTDAETGRPLPDRQLADAALAALPSADGQFLLVSERVGAGGRADPEYRWSIFSIGTGERIGDVRRDVSATPFFVASGNVVYQSEPYGELRDGVWVDEPVKVRAVALSGGSDSWDREVRDLAFRGPLPSFEPPEPPPTVIRLPENTSASSTSRTGPAVPFPRPAVSAPRTSGAAARLTGQAPPAGSLRTPTADGDEPEPSLAPAPLDPPALPTVGGAWTSQGPGPITGGQAEGITNNPVVGAIQAIVAHPTDANTAWVGAVNGGVWKTTNATNASPTWTAQGDAFASLSVSSLDLDPTEATHNTLVAGLGKYSSFGGVGGTRPGAVRTTNGGMTWTPLGGATLTGKSVAAVAARGATVVVAVNVADSFTCANIGIFRSTNTGASFTAISGGATLPQGDAIDMAGDPTNNAVLYTAVRETDVCTGTNTNGIYKSTDTGATWTRVSNSAMNTLMATNSTFYQHALLAVGQSGEVYAGIVNGGKLAGLFRSGNGGSTWTSLDRPSSTENGTAYGIHPGGQGSIHFSIVADKTNANIVYIGGDRQPANSENGGAVAQFPNSLGANNYSGRLYRIDAAATPGTQATPLTHCATATAACLSTVSTTLNSSPHADSRRMVMDANGNILEADDGGIYRRSNPKGTGDWTSVNGTLRVTEAHDVAYDHVSQMIMSGHQDTGTAEQRTIGAATWTGVEQGDGGDIAIDDISSATQSTRYSSSQNLGGFRRRVVSAAGATTLTQFPARTVLGGGATFVPQFVTPVEVNRVVPGRILLAGANDLYESLDKGDTITALAWAKAATAMVYGGVSGGVNNPALIYALDGTDVYVRTAGSGSPTLVAAPGGDLQDVAIDSADWQDAWVINSTGSVFATTNAGASWTNVTGNLGSGATSLRTIAFLPGPPSSVVVGGLNGVFQMATSSPGVWNQFGSGMPSAVLVYDLSHSPSDNTLVAGTMGRGSWNLSTSASSPVLAVNPGSLAFGSVTIGSFQDLTVTVSNTGGGTLTGTATTSAPFSVQSGGSYSLAGGASQTVTVRFAPTVAGAAAGSLTLTGGGGATVSLGGTGVATGLTFTVVGPTTVPPGASVQVQVTGGPGFPRDWVGLYATSAVDTGWIDWKYLSGTRTPPATGLTAAVIAFTMPGAQGTYNLRFFQNNTYAKLATSTTVTVQVTDPLIQATPTSLAFGSVNVGGSRDLTVTVKNAGAGTLTGTATATGIGFSLIGASSYSLGPNVTAVLTVRFAPPATGAASGSLSLTGGGGTAVPLSGAGTSIPTITVVGPTTVAPGASVQVQVSNGPGYTTDWVALHAVSAADTTWLDWKYLSGTRTAPTMGLTAATLTFTMPMSQGTYNFRFFQNNAYTKLATSGAVVVQQPSPSLSVSTTTATPGQIIQVTVANGPGAPKDWVAMHATAAANTVLLDWKYLNGTRTSTVGFSSATVSFTLPTTPGTYHFRFFANNTYTRLATSPTVTVSTPVSNPTVTVSTTTASPGQSIQVTLADGPGNPSDWMAMHGAAAADTAYFDWKYLNGTRTPPATGLSGATLTFTVPMTPGTYNFRFFQKNTFTKLATSPTVTVQ